METLPSDGVQAVGPVRFPRALGAGPQKVSSQEGGLCKPKLLHGAYSSSVHNSQNMASQGAQIQMNG